MALVSVRGRGTPASEFAIFASFLVVPLVIWPGLPDPFTHAKWYLLCALAAAWLLVERFLCGSRGLPPVLARSWPAWAALGVSVIVGGVRNGLGWAVQPLTARAAFVALTLASFWYFRRTRLRVAPLRAAILASVTVVIGLGLAQFAGLDLVSWLPGGDHRSATFGNVNMAAQFVGLALVVLLAVAPAGPGSMRRRPASIVKELSAAAALAYLWLAGSRSAGLALVAAVVVLMLVGRITAWRLLRAGGVATLLAWLVLAIAPAVARPLASSSPESKRASAMWRLAVWSDTAALVRDHPFGVGAGNFEHAFIPYALAGRSRPGEALVFRSPHNEYLRVLAEEGLTGGILLLALVALVVRELHRSPPDGSWGSDQGALLAAVGVFLAVEAAFQFPFEMAFPSLLAAVLLGLALACLDGAPAPPPHNGSRGEGRNLQLAGDVACVLVALAIGVGLTRIAVAEYLVANDRDEVAAFERACTLDPRRLEACVEAAWLRSRAGEHAAARRALDAVLHRSPHYFPAIKLLGEDLLATGGWAAGCRCLRRYDEMFGGHSSVHERVREYCPQATP